VVIFITPVPVAFLIRYWRRPATATIPHTYLHT